MDNNWLLKASSLYQEKQKFVIITIIDNYQSSPRNQGAKMIVTEQTQYGSIGGGNLEFQATKLAHEMLREKSSKLLKTYNLSASLGQCCGGKVTLLLENCSFYGTPVIIFGGGHVTTALLPILLKLPYQVTVVESRQDFFEKLPNSIGLFSSEPADEVSSFVANSYYIVMTHSHSLDLLICEAILKREDFAYLGIIGSQKKAARFKNQLAKKKYSKSLLNSINCPIGLNLKNTKLPIEIAVAIAAQLLEKIK